MKHVIFDFDGTLVDSIDLFLQIGMDLTDKYKLRKMNREEILQLNTLPIKERLKRLEIPFYLLPKIILDVLGKYKQYAAGLKISDKIKCLLKELKESGLCLSVISSNSVGNIIKCLKANGIEFIDRIYSTNGALDKSSAISKFLREYGIETENVIYVGDELRDIQACKKAHVRVMAVTWGYDPAELLKQGEPDYLIDTPADAMEVLKRFCSDKPDSEGEST